MSQFSFQIYLIFQLYMNYLTHSVLLQNQWPRGTMPFPKEKCESLLKSCSCYDYYQKAAIVCNNMTDFANLNRILKSGDIFDVNIHYEITFTGVKHVSSGVLKDLGLFRFILDDPDVTVDEDVLEGVAVLYQFRVRRSSIKDIPNFNPVRSSIQTINIDSSRLISLEGKNLQNLTDVVKLSFFNNSIRFIDQDVFKGTESVIILDLSHNLLTSLPRNLLDPMVNISKFVVSNNNLLHANGLFSVTHPKFIYLDFNNITDVDSVLQYNMERTIFFAVASNPIKKVSVNSFNGKIPNVVDLYLDHCDIREFNVSHYQLKKLATLDLSYNLIEEISTQDIDIGKKLELHFIGNQIRKFGAKISASVKRLYLSDNKLEILNTTLQFTQMEEVEVSRNQLQYLTDQDLRSVHGTSNLEFQENKISRIDTRTFAPINNDLHYLDFSFNLITSLNRSMKLLSQLKLLNLTHNLIESFARDEFTGLNELSELYLQYNKIKALGQLLYLERLQYLVITHNNVELITPEQVPRKLRFMYLKDNPLKCTCRFQPFLLWLNKSDSPVTDVDLCLQPVTENNLLSNALKCPSMCSCACANYAENYFISVDCSSRNLSDIPEFLKNNFLHIQSNTTKTFDYRHPLIMDQNEYPALHIEDYALGINLENNSLEFSSLEEAQILPNLIQLYLANNKLKQLPMHMMDNLRQIKKMSLSGNPWECDCNALRFKKWLTSKYDVVHDINNTRCTVSNKGETELSGKVIWTLTDLDICPADIGLYISVGFAILIILLIGLASKVLYIKYELNVKVFLYSRGFTFVKAEDLDYDKAFDAFVSFSHQDDAFVTKEIILEIEERDPNIRLCIHYRNFMPGEFIYNNIISAVQNSKRTVLILTRNFLESYWCVMEFRAAHIQALEDKVHRIIVIKVGDLPKDIDPAIQVYLDSTTYLTWGEKHFWQKLMYVLPTNNTPRDPIPMNIRERFGMQLNIISTA